MKDGRRAGEFLKIVFVIIGAAVNEEDKDFEPICCCEEDEEEDPVCCCEEAPVAEE